MRCELKNVNIRTMYVRTYTAIGLASYRPVSSAARPYAESGCSYGAEVTRQPVATNYRSLIMHTLELDYNVRTSTI